MTINSSLSERKQTVTPHSSLSERSERPLLTQNSFLLKKVFDIRPHLCYNIFRLKRVCAVDSWRAIRRLNCPPRTEMMLIDDSLCLQAQGIF